MTLEGLVKIQSGVLGEVARYLHECGYGNVVIAADERTYQVAGERLQQEIEHVGIRVRTTLIDPDRQGDVIADEASIVQLLLPLRQEAAEAVIAVGSGTLHDISRFSAYTVGIPFVSVPTAPSVDGFNSDGPAVLATRTGPFLIEI